MDWRVIRRAATKRTRSGSFPLRWAACGHSPGRKARASPTPRLPTGSRGQRARHGNEACTPGHRLPNDAAARAGPTLWVRETGTYSGPTIAAYRRSARLCRRSCVHLPHCAGCWHRGSGATLVPYIGWLMITPQSEGGRIPAERSAVVRDEVITAVMNLENDANVTSTATSTATVLRSLFSSGLCYE